MRTVLLLATLALGGCAGIRPAVRPPLELVSVAPRPKVMLVGTFHFEDAGLDTYKPKHAVDIRTPQRQRELEALLTRLARFQPTKVAVEVGAEALPRLNERYQEYLAGKFTLPGNEIYQIGFRLARRLGHAQLYAIDAEGRDYDSREEGLAQIKSLGQEHLANTEWDARFQRLYEHDDVLKTRVPLLTFFRYINSRERVRLGHGHYLTGMFHAGRGSNYIGADYVTGWWYNRNLRIFENIHRVIEGPSDRVLVIIGAGHLSVLRDAAESSPEIDSVDVLSVLK